ncbi:NB-ARC domain-containing protein [Micromonospora andamanensis]|uniref:SARP family transcriptional regulator n=1 Tax=Micromonospora andamanensis TaxID=1287068 RepID=A0ABQ4I364_9ACTN|nr:NB-ARC domain-containing protein [Micromonospora andamanensis]GIJ12297.1 SARP family transcriptional regulator [Micromonospora andamanensis]
MTLQLRILGRLQGFRNGKEIELGSPQQRIVLAALLTSPGTPVALTTLAEVLWGDASPRAAAATIHQYISQLRRTLGCPGPAQAADGPIHRTASGYRVAAEEVEVDVTQWRRLVAEARSQSSVVAHAAAAELWSGPVASGLPLRVRDHALFAGLDRELVDVLIEAADLAADSGGGEVLVASLTRAARWHPTHEGLRNRLARARDAAEPQEDRQRIRPMQLPPRPAAFSGRQPELDLLDRLAHPGSVIVVGGLGGVGKTSLALRWAHEAATRFPDGQLYLDLTGFSSRGSPMRPGDALHAFLEGLGVPRAHQPSTLDELARLYRSILADRRIVVVLDNARDEAQVRPLLPPEGSTTLVTSRNRLSGLIADEGASPVTLEVFDSADAERYLRRRLGDDRVAADPAAVAQIIEVCGGLPLALAICAAWADRNPAFTLTDVAAELSRRRGLDAFASVTAGRDVRAVYSWSYEQLSPGAARLFRRLAWHPGADVALPTVVSMVGVGATETLAWIAELADAQLLTEIRPGRYASHDLVKAYAVELVADGDSEAETLPRILDHYVHSLIAAAGWANPFRRQIGAGEPPEGVTPEVFTNRSAAIAWFDAERENLRSAMDVAEAYRLDWHVLRLCWGLNGFLLDLTGQWDEAIPLARRALKVARRTDESWWEGYLHNVLGNSCHRVRRHEEAYRHWELAADVGRRIGDPVRTAIGLLGMGISLTSRDRWPADDLVEQAASCGDQIRELLTDIDRQAPPGRGDPQVTHTRELLGFTYEFSALRVLHRTGDIGAAVAERMRGIELHRQIESLPRQQLGWQSIGRIQEYAGGDSAAAARAYAEALALVENDEWIGAELLVALTRCHTRLGEHDTAGRYRCRARQRLEGVHHPPAQRLRAELDTLA